METVKQMLMCHDGLMQLEKKQKHRVPSFPRATALLLSVSHLVLVTRNACHMSGSLDWIDQSLHAAEDHMVVLREAALASEPERSIPGADAQREQAI